MTKDIDLYPYFTHLSEWAQSLTPSDLPIGADSYVTHCLSQFAPPKLERLLHQLTEQMGAHVGKTLYPVNSFLRRYEHGAVVKRHVDRKEIEWTASLVLHHQGPAWPLHTDDGPLYGQTILLKSREIEHWREPFDGTVSVVGLLHWHSHSDLQVPQPATRSQPVVKSQPAILPNAPHFMHVSQALSGQEITDLYRQFNNQALRPGMISYRGIPSSNRANMIAWLRRNEGWQWLYDTLFGAAHYFNQRYWNLDITGLSIDEIQFTRYAPGEYYGWHQDVDIHAKGQTAKRSLSVVCLVSAPDQGGGLELRNGGVIPMNPGDAVIFPATEEHRALLVEEGMRDSLILWLSKG